MTPAPESPLHPLLVLALLAAVSLPVAGDRQRPRAVPIIGVVQYDGPIPPPPPVVNTGGEE